MITFNTSTSFGKTPVNPKTKQMWDKLASTPKKKGESPVLLLNGRSSRIENGQVVSARK